MTRYLTLFALLVSLCTRLSAASKPVELKWTELSPVIATHSVTLNLTDGGKVTGEAVTVREDALVMDVKQSIGSKPYNKGNATLDRKLISSIELHRTRGSWGRGLGTTLGVLVGMGIGGEAASHQNSLGTGTTVFVGITSGMAVAGYYIGRSLDRDTTHITILP
jgi:hypothetical protein